MVKTDFGEQVGDNAVAHNGDSGRRLHKRLPAPLQPVRLRGDGAARLERRLPLRSGRLGGVAALSGAMGRRSAGPTGRGWRRRCRGGLSWGASGAPCYATDIGGFYADGRDAELFVRWTQGRHLLLPHPLPRNRHARALVLPAPRPKPRSARRYACAIGSCPTCGRRSDRRTRPACPSSAPWRSPFPDAPPAWMFEGQFMFGDDLLVVPATEPGGRIRVYLPAGRWHDWGKRRGLRRRRGASTSAG